MADSNSFFFADPTDNKIKKMVGTTVVGSIDVSGLSVGQISTIDENSFFFVDWTNNAVKKVVNWVVVQTVTGFLYPHGMSAIDANSYFVTYNTGTVAKVVNGSIVLNIPKLGADWYGALGAIDATSFWAIDVNSRVLSKIVNSSVSLSVPSMTGYSLSTIDANSCLISNGTSIVKINNGTTTAFTNVVTSPGMVSVIDQTSYFAYDTVSKVVRKVINDIVVASSPVNGLANICRILGLQKEPDKNNRLFTKNIYHALPSSIGRL